MTHPMPLTERLEAIRTQRDSDDVYGPQSEHIDRLKELSGELFDLALEMRSEYDRLNAEIGGLRRELQVQKRRNHDLSTKLVEHQPWREGGDVPW